MRGAYDVYIQLSFLGFTLSFIAFVIYMLIRNK